MLWKIVVIALAINQNFVFALRDEIDADCLPGLNEYYRRLDQRLGLGARDDDDPRAKNPDVKASENANIKYLLDDMILGEDQMDLLFAPVGRRNALKDKQKLWPNKTVPVKLSDDFNEKQKHKIWSTLEHLMNVTCVIFKNYTSGPDFVDVRPRDSCSSFVGYEGGSANISLNIKGCLDTGRIIHEFMHILGFYHMHTTVKRDDYVTIMWQNIKPDYHTNFVTYESEVTMFDTEYDYDSVMHYSSMAFSSNGNKTIVPKIAGADLLMGQRTHLSKGDITRLNKLYNC